MFLQERPRKDRLLQVEKRNKKQRQREIKFWQGDKKDDGSSDANVAI